MQMALTVKPSDFINKVQLGHVENIQVGGVNRDKFVSDYTLHYKEQKRTLSQQYQLVGSRLDDTITIITRHDSRNSKATKAHLGSTDYDVLDCSPDDSGDYIRYDYFTLKKVQGHG